jgi:hypothetical protein
MVGEQVPPETGDANDGLELAANDRDVVAAFNHEPLEPRHFAGPFMSDDRANRPGPTQRPKVPETEAERRAREDRRLADRRAKERRVDDMRWAGIGEIQSERRKGPRRDGMRRSAASRRSNR